MNVIFDTLFYSPDVREKISAGIDSSEFKKTTDVYYEKCLINITQVESAIPNVNFKDHTTLNLFSGDSFVVKFKTSDYFSICDHISANKLLCKINN